jgi:hypothetical protein
MNHDDSYYSVERLVEFGISMAVAQQMISGFQQAMSPLNQTQVIAPAQTMSRVYFAIVGGTQVGPLSNHDIIRMVRDREINANTLLWTAGMPQWKSASSFPEIMSIVALAPPQVL